MRDDQSDEHRLAPYRRSNDAVLSSLLTDSDDGLSDSEAVDRLGRDGPNVIAGKPGVSRWRKFLGQFTDVLVVLLIVAASISAGLWFYQGDSDLPYEAMAIFAIVFLNAVMGYFLEERAQKAVNGLRKMSALHANVIRGGNRDSIAASDLVVGDIILVEEGDTVPADARLIRSASLQTAEAALTGESVPVSKDISVIQDECGVSDRVNMIFSGTAATYGRGTAVVTATGMKTEMGRIAGLLEEAPEDTTPLQKELDRVGRRLGLIVVAIAVVMIGTILLVEDIQGLSGVFSVLILGVALAVAAVPEGLPAVVTAVLSVGVQRMAKRKVIVRHLSSVETLGSTNVIASDKTGTLTRNEMTVRRIVTATGSVKVAGTGYDPSGIIQTDGDPIIEGDLRSESVLVLEAATLANNASLQSEGGAWSIHGDPTEAALLVAGRKIGLSEEGLAARFRRLAELPFSSERKLMSVAVSDADRPDTVTVATKGAADVLLSRCTKEAVGGEERPMTPERRTEILLANEALASEALRTLGVAFRRLPKQGFQPEELGEDMEHELVFLGLVGMIDPPRDEARKAVALARAAGIRPIMITGDHPVTATVIAAELGIATNGRSVTGSEIRKMTDEMLDRTVGTVSVYARVDPEHKLRIVQSLQRSGMTVAMTGDGVNDAPALKTADIGIAMGITGTDVSKEAADMILVDDNFASIVAAVEEGRAIYGNIRKFLRYLLSSNFGEVITMFFGILLADYIGLTEAGGGGFVLPLLATHILWINLLTDGLPALALGVDPSDADTMKKPPRPRGERIVTMRMWGGIVVVGTVMAVGTLAILDASLPGGFIEGSGTLDHGRTMAFTTLVFFQLFNVLNARSDIISAFHGMFRNGWLWGAIGLSVLLQLAVLYIPFLQAAFSTVALDGLDLATCIIVASSVLWLWEIIKFGLRVRRFPEASLNRGVAVAV